MKISHKPWLRHTLLVTSLLVASNSSAQKTLISPAPISPAPVVPVAPRLVPVQPVNPPATTSAQPSLVAIQKTTPIAVAPALYGFVDMHTHPMSNLAFGGKLIHGGPDVGSLLPADADCHQKVRATSLEQALGNDNGTHGGWGLDNGCGDEIRKQVIKSLEDQKHNFPMPGRAHGAPDFGAWPRWNDITHQKMWIDWIRRAYDGGLRVMVSLATNNATLAAAVSGPGDGPTDDRASGDLQITEIKGLVARHRDFMEIAYSAADLQRIVTAGHLAIVLGVELDNIGNFNKVPGLSDAMIRSEIARLYGEGVRYIFPIHVIDNKFGGTAVYEGAFNTSNYRETGSFWDIECAAPSDQITYRYSPDGWDAAVAFVKATKLGIDIARNPPTPPACSGHVNRKGLTAQGEFAIREMMRQGMLIDIDHMSQKSANRALEIAESIPGGGYPVNSGHNSLRAVSGHSENSRTNAQLRKIAVLHGMVGVGFEGVDAHKFAQNYAAVLYAMGNSGAAIGTDLNGMVMGPGPRPGSSIHYDASFPKSRSGTKEWDYNAEGVAHYGLLNEYVKDMRTAPSAAPIIDDSFMHSADYFFKTWEKAEAQKANVH